MDKLSSSPGMRRYVRPGQKWECGWACEGTACRIGPSPKGECRATFECRPVLERASGEEKGRWRCTRPEGACQTGPSPEGECACAIAKCSPRRSLRAKRGLLTWMTVTFCIALLMILGGGPRRWEFLSPGALSTAHTSEAFRRLEKQHFNTENGCGGCHGAARQDNPGWVQQALQSSPHPMNLGKLVTFDHKELTRVDQSCLTCHQEFGFHQPTLPHDYSCMACHQEHRGMGRLAPPRDTHCQVCHGDEAVMMASTKLGEEIPVEAFSYARIAHGGLVTFDASRPATGYTHVFKSFEQGHPEFQIHREQLEDEHALRFNHALHLGDRMPSVKGQKLQCGDCHKPDASGAGFLRVNFKDNCQACHAVQFDPGNPGLEVPHGDVEAVRGFLRSLPRQYADLALRQGKTSSGDQEAFALEQLRALAARYPTGEELEQAVFLNRDPSRGHFAGCAYCHAVTPKEQGGFSVEPPRIPDVWMPHARFHHESHRQMACTDCHPATSSHETRDVLLPKLSNCISCHSPQGGVAHSCVTCHGYHNFLTDR